MAHPFKDKAEMHPGRKMAEKRYGKADPGKYARGGRAKGKGNKTTVNIAVLGGGNKEPGGPMMPPGGMPPIPKGPMAPPPGIEAPGGMPQMARGGKVPMKAGAETGQGRLEKIKAYGKKNG